MTLAVHAALGEMRAHSASLRARGTIGLYSSPALDNKRKCSAWTEYGWPEVVTSDNLYWLYRREGIAFGAVEKLLGRCWSEAPEVIEGDESDNKKEKTEWERRNNATLSAAWLWAGFAESDRRRLVRRWSGLILHIADNQTDWAKPVQRSRTTAGYRLDKVTPVWENALQVLSYDETPNSPTYGEPTMWQYTEEARNNRPAIIRKIHPDRVFILGDYSGDPIGFLEPVYNAFVSLEKVSGGSGESFLKNAARQMAVNYEKDIDWDAMAKRYGVSKSELHAKVQEAARDLNVANDLLFITQGAQSITPLVSQVADPEPTFSVNLQIVSAGVDIPSKILVGNQTGERASTEDDAYMNKRCQSRRDQSLAPEVLDFVRHLMRVNVLTETASMLTVMWGDLTLPTQTERLANAKQMSEVNASNIGGDGPVFTTSEIREAAGYENDPDDALPPAGEDDEEEDDGDPQA